MEKVNTLILGILFLTSSLAFCQEDSLSLEVTPVESVEILDYFRFEGIDYFKLMLSAEGVANQYFMITSNEYWNGELTKIDTIANTKMHKLKNGSDTVGIRILSKKIDTDKVKFQFNLPRFSVTRKFQTTSKNTYSLRDITSNRHEKFGATEPVNFLVYSLPYEDPKYPGYLFYCELSREGIPPEKWGERFGVEHYIVFKVQILN